MEVDRTYGSTLTQRSTRRPFRRGFRVL